VKILIAEDNVVSRTLLQAALRAWGYEVVSVTNGTEALELLQCEDAPPLAILDVDMPGMEGTEVCKRLQESPRPTSTYIILLTANADKAAAVAGLEAGADDYVTKPFDQGELRARVQVGARMVRLQESRAKYIRVLEDTFAQLESSSATLTQLNGKMLKEISDRTRVEEELRLQQILLESQSEASLDGVLVISAEGKIISVNHHFIEIWSLADEVLATKSGAAALQTIADHLDDPGEFLERADWTLQHTDEKSDQELILKDGRILHYYSAPVKSSDGVYYGRASYFRDITERKRSEEEKAQLTDRLESQRQRLNTFIANTPGMVWEAWGEPDAAMQRTGFASDYVETMLGYTVEEWIATPNIWFSIMHPDDKERNARELRANYASGRGGVMEFRWIAKDGHIVWVETQYAIICDGEGKSIGLRGATMNITERKRAEEALSESEERYRVVAETATDVIITVDETSKILFANGAVETLFGYAVSELLGEEITLLIPEYLRYPPKTTVESYRQTGRKHIKWEAVEVPGLHKSGREIPLELSFGQFSKDGKRFFTAIARDITERKRAESAMRKSDERYRDLVENARDIIYTHDLKGNYTSTNRAGEEITGYTREETLQLNIADTIAPEYVEKARRMLTGKLAGEKETVYDLEIIAKDGHRISVEVNTRLVFQGDAPIGVQGIARDVTERRQLERQLRQSQKMESIGQLAAGIAHEINTPTQYVGDNLRFMQEAYQAQTQVMEEYGGLFAAAQLGSVSAEQLEEVRRVIKEADLQYVAVEVPKALKQSLEGVDRIAKIVQSMKEFAHPDSAEKKAVDLNRAIESTINVARGEWKYVAELETDFDLSLPPVPCLVGELNQMTLNLIINSSHAIADKMKTEGQGKGVIKITTRREEDWAVMRVSDTGVGIPLQLRSRVFDPFFTTKEVGKGTGQGLAISHTVVEKHGGTITFETAEGEGTTFIVRLPLDELAKTPGGLKEAA
jgi:PAS domain S-box-containing protein